MSFTLRDLRGQLQTSIDQIQIRLWRCAASFGFLLKNMQHKHGHLESYCVYGTVSAARIVLDNLEHTRVAKVAQCFGRLVALPGLRQVQRIAKGVYLDVALNLVSIRKQGYFSRSILPFRVISHTSPTVKCRKSVKHHFVREIQTFPHRTQDFNATGRCITFDGSAIKSLLLLPSHTNGLGGKPPKPVKVDSIPILVYRASVYFATVDYE